MQIDDRAAIPFRQIDGSYQRACGGTGLGLAIVKETVAAREGTLQAKSTIGQGSTFTVTLPLAVNAREMI